MRPVIVQHIGRRISSCGRFFMRLAGAWAPGGGRSRAGKSPGRLGPSGERLAARHLQQLGYRILHRSHRTRWGEIDLIAVDGACIVFVEVKTWTLAADGDPALAVDADKQRRITRAALVYLKQRGLLEQPTRFDVVSIRWPSDRSGQPTLRHIRAAFEASGPGQLFG